MTLRRIRQVLAVVFALAITLLFLDFTGTVHRFAGWLPRIQFLPALLAGNVIIVGALIVLTLLLGRVYCSVICPLGVMQDVFGAAGKRARRNRYTYSPAITWLRWLMVAVLAVSIVAGIGVVVALMAPYSAYGRIVQNLAGPLWAAGNNVLASMAERTDSYAFYRVDVWVRSWPVFAVAAVTFIVLGILAWRNGRTYCNTFCPVGTVLGFFSRFSLFRPIIDTTKCNGCGLCARNCKAACINSKEHTIDYSRCVACMDCLDKCNRHAISYSARRRRPAADEITPDTGRRNFMTAVAGVAVASVASAKEKTVDGGLAVIEDKKAPHRQTPIVPAGALSLNNMARHCTACQLCVAACPNGVLRPSTRPESFMQPEVSYERGYCRPECTKCSEVCPTGAINLIDRADKSSIQTGHAVWIKENCLPAVDGISCGNCARHCPVGAITMVRLEPDDETSPLIPAVNAERCIGCGACENLCPARPFSAIYVEGHESHRTI